MPFIAGLGDPISGLGGVITADDGSSSTSGPIWNQVPHLVVTVNDVELPNVMSASIVLGLDISVAGATVVLDLDNDGQVQSIPQNARITINCGTGPHNIDRFSGRVKRQRGKMWPHTLTLFCRGKLHVAEKYKQSKGAAMPSFFVETVNSRLPIIGVSMLDILNGSTATDENYIVGLLNLVPGIEFDPNDIGGTGHVFGLSAYRELFWQPYVSALAQAQKLDEVCLGYRLFEGLNGRILRTQVFGYPTNVSDATFTEGVDIWESEGDRSIENLMNAEYVEGYIFGGHPGLIGSYRNESNDFQSSDDPFIDTFSSPLIEDFEFADQVAEWRLGEKNRELVEVNLTTFRDDRLYPGRTVTVLSPHSIVNGEPVWIQHLEIQVRNNPILFQQTIRGLGGGLAGGSGVGSYPPPNVFL